MKERFTEKEIELLPVFREKYLSVVLKPKAGNMQILRDAVKDAYAILDMPTPDMVLVDSPRGAVKALLSAKKNGSKDIKDTFSKKLVIDLKSSLWHCLCGQYSTEILFMTEAVIGNPIRAAMNDIENAICTGLRKDYSDEVIDSCKATFMTRIDANLIAFYKFFEQIGAKICGEDLKIINILDRALHQCQFMWPYDSVCIVSQNPTKIQLELDKTTNMVGPAILYKDGFLFSGWPK